MLSEMCISLSILYTVPLNYLQNIKSKTFEFAFLPKTSFISPVLHRYGLAFGTNWEYSKITYLVLGTDCSLELHPLSVPEAIVPVARTTGRKHRKGILTLGESHKAGRHGRRTSLTKYMPLGNISLRPFFW